MTLSAEALTSLDNLKRYLEISSSSNDALLESLIEAVSKQFAVYTGRNLTLRSYSPLAESDDYDPDNAVLDGSGHAELLLPQYPVDQVTGVTLNGAALSPAQPGGASGWWLDHRAGLVVLKDGLFSRGGGNVLVAYRAGFSPVPADLAQAALEQAAMRFQESSAGHGRLGVAARTLADGSLSYSQKALLPQVREVLDRYRNRSAL